MALLEIPNIRKEKNIEEQVKALMDAYAILKRQLEFFIQVIDSDNIPRLNTNLTQISSERGETVINGPLLEMKDASTTLRFKVGLNKSTGKFEFILKDVNGDTTVNISDVGRLILSGQAKIELYDESDNLRLVMGYDATLNKFVFGISNVAGKPVFALADTGQGLLGDEIVQGSADGTTDKKYIISNGSVGIQIKVDTNDIASILSTDYLEISSYEDMKIEALDDIFIETGGILKLIADGDLSIISNTGYIFAQGTWRFDNHPYIGNAVEESKILKKSEIESLINSAIAAHVAAYHSGP